MYKRPKIIKVEEPKEKRRWACWIVYFDYGDGKISPAYMHEEDYLVLMEEEELIKKGYDIKELEKYKELITDRVSRDIYDNVREE